MSELILTVRCVKDENHAKKLYLHKVPKRPSTDALELLVQVLNGTSVAYRSPPADRSPIGRCVLCGARLEVEIHER